MNMQTHRRQRISQQYTDGDNTIDKVWAGVCEYITKNGQQYKHTYLTGPMGVFAIHIIKPDGTEEINYIHTDHLGSWNTITDENGNLLQEQSFDAWGNKRDPNTWRAYTTTAPEPLFDRGFTGHEHLNAFNLINMNGRFYDPIIGRMLSPDNFMQAPDYTQSFNRYSYCWNNPLKYIDPTGNELGLVDGYNGFGYYLGYSGGIGPGSGNHWSDQYRGQEGNFMLMNQSTFTNMYGAQAYQNMFNKVTGNSTTYNWNPVAGNEAYRESYSKDGVNYLDVYYEGAWVKVNSGNGRASGLGDGITGQDILGLFMQTGNFISSASDDVRAFVNGKYIHGNGNVYSLKFYGNQHVSKYSVIGSKATSLQYAKAVGRVSAGLTVVGGVVTLADGLLGEDGWQNHHTADLALSVIIYGTAAAVPVAGWIVGGLYFVGDMASQYYTGKSLTENLFD